MSDFSAEFEPGSGRLALSGALAPDDWTAVLELVDRAFRRTPCSLVVDLSRLDSVPSETLGLLVHVCNTCYPGTVIRLPQRDGAGAAA